MGALGKREKPFRGKFPSLFPPSPFPLSAEALAKVENLLLAFIYFANEIDKCPLKFEKKLFQYLFCLSTDIGNRVKQKGCPISYA